MATEVLTQTTQASIPLAASQDQKPKPSSKFSGDQDVGFTDPETPAFKNKFEEREYVKGRLAAAYRICGHFGLNEGAAGHITMRDPVEPDTFWVNPFGVDFNLINKSDLLRVDHHGNILDHGRVKVLNKAAFLIHGAIHAARPDVACAAHMHSVHGRAFCSLGRPIDMLTLETCIFYDVCGP
jgi:ribulose-5-phosphate 4-epimerase/fuculose-1-phosphate aldolase